MKASFTFQFKRYEYGIVEMTNNIALYISSLLKEAEANKLKLTPQFLELKFIEAIADNTKIFFGEKVFPSLLCVCLCVCAGFT